MRQQEAGSARHQHAGKRRDERQDVHPRHHEAVDDADREPRAEAAEQSGNEAVGRQQRRDDAGAGRRRSDREVDAGGHDDEAHAEAGQREHRIVAQHAQTL